MLVLNTHQAETHVGLLDLYRNDISKAHFLYNIAIKVKVRMTMTTIMITTMIIVTTAVIIVAIVVIVTVIVVTLENNNYNSAF